jgi:hypothetical protein
VKGGDGGNGGNGGDGGPGGDAGRTNDPLWGYTPGVPGGYPGAGGKGGYGGKGGRIAVANNGASLTDLVVDRAHGGHGGEGGGGAPGNTGAPERERPIGETRPQSWSKARIVNVTLPVIPATRALQPTVDADSKTDGSAETAKFLYQSLRRHITLSQLRMLLERLRYVFLRICRADLSIDPAQQNPDLKVLLAGLQWMRNLLGTHDDCIDAVSHVEVAPHVPGLMFFRRGLSLKYDATTRQPGRPDLTRPINEDWPQLSTDGTFDTFAKGPVGRYVFCRASDVIFHLQPKFIGAAGYGAAAVTASLKVALGGQCEALWDGIDMAVNVTTDGHQGYIFKGGNYYRYRLGVNNVPNPPIHFTKIEGPFPTERDFPRLWFTNASAAFTGVENRIFLFQKTGSYDKDYKYNPPQYMIYDLGLKKIEPGYPKNIAEDWPGLFPEEFTFTAADRAMADALLLKANFLYDNIRSEVDYFGNTSTYVVLGTETYFDQAKEDALRYLANAETEYNKYQTAMKDSKQTQAGLQIAVNVAGSQYIALQEETTKLLSDAQKKLGEVNRLRGLLDAKGKALERDAGDLKTDVSTKWGVSWQDMFGCLTQLSFMHWGNLPEKIESGPVFMATSQAGDLLVKGINNVVTDSGQSISRAYVVHQVDTMAKGIRSFKDLTLNRSKFIDPTNLYNDAYKLTVTRDQFRNLCDEFTKSFSSAQRIIEDLDEYVTLADQRNAAVLEYNQLWRDVYDMQAEAAKCKLDYEHAQSALSGNAQPNLAVYTSFATERYNRARDQTLEIYYLANRAGILKSLTVRNLFSDMLRALPATGRIDAATFTQESLEDVYKKIKDMLSSSGPTGPRTAHIVFEKSTHPAMFAAWARNEVATFTVRRATPKTKSGPFADLANVRLRRVRCWAGGLAPGDHSFTLQHTGRETFVTSRGKDVTVDHEPKTLDYKYRCNSAIDPTAQDFMYQGEEWPMLLTDEYELLGPFTTWTIALNEQQDRAKATSLRIEFDVVHQAFEPSSRYLI